MENLIPGRASINGTAAYRDRFVDRVAPDHFRTCDRLTVASIGLGTYLGHDDEQDDAQYREAVARALALGTNVLDSAINYRSMRSERAVGAGLRDAIAAGTVRREEVLVATKGGYLPFDAARPSHLYAYIDAEYLRPGIFTKEDLVEGCHCMAPRFLDDQIARSRKNIGLETIDVYYLHNPEAQLAAIGREEFLRRVTLAFAALEQAVGDGRIARYGTATWTGYRQAAGAANALVLEELVEAARAVGGEGHHFRVVQLPVNLAMQEAARLANQPWRGRTLTLLEAAREAGVYVMASASILQGRLSQPLPETVARALPGLRTDAQRALQFTRSLPGVGTALVGMKQLAHVDEDLEVAHTPPADHATVLSLA